MKSKWEETLEEPVSEELKQRTLRRAQAFVGVNANRHFSQQRNFYTWALAGLSALAALFLYLRFPKEPSTAFDADLETLASLETEDLEDFELFLDLDVLEDMDILEQWEES